jgi:hypothetical protein
VVAHRSLPSVLLPHVSTSGFLFLGFRPAAFFGCMFVYVLNCFFAAVNVFTEGQTLEKLFLFGTAWTVQTAVVAAYLPYEDWSHTLSQQHRS